MEESSYKRRLVRLGGASALAIGLAAGGFGVASAATSTPGTSSTGGQSANSQSAPPGPGAGFRGGPGGHDGPGGPGGPGHGPGGIVASIGTNSFTIKHDDGTTQTVNTTSSTTYERDGQASTASALAVGQHVGVRPTGPPPAPPSGSSTDAAAPSSTPITAAEVDIMDPSIHGTVQSVNGNVVTVVDDQGFWRTVNVSASTTYTNNGQSATQSALTTGAKLVAFGSVDADHTSLDATTVAVNPPRPQPPAGQPGAGSSQSGSASGSSTSS